MTDRELEIRGHATWAVSTISAIEILKRNNAEGHAQQLTYSLRKFYDIAVEKFGDEFQEVFHILFEETNGPTNKDQGNSSVDGETLH